MRVSSAELSPQNGAMVRQRPSMARRSRKDASQRMVPSDHVSRSGYLAASGAPNVRLPLRLTYTSFQVRPPNGNAKPSGTLAPGLAIGVPRLSSADEALTESLYP